MDEMYDQVDGSGLSNPSSENPSHEELIRQHFSNLVEELKPQLFLHRLMPSIQDLIDEDIGRKAQCRCLLRVLMRSPKEYFENFCEIIAGIHPTLFVMLKRRKPTDKESESYLKPFCERLRQNVINTGSKTDNRIDSTIDLDTQFVCPKMSDISREHGEKSCSSNYSSFEPVESILIKTSIGKSILLTGRAGGGKSTLAQYLNRRWAKDKELSSYSTVFLLNLRRIAHIQQEITFTELLAMYAEYTPSPVEPLQPVHEWLENNQEKILFLTDGIDELSDLSRLFRGTPKFATSMMATPLEWCVNLMKRNIMQKSTLLLISRPFIGLKTLDYDRHIDILGLSHDKVMEYVELNVKEERQAVVKETLVRNLVLLSVCSISFYCAAICRILSEDERIDSEMLTTYTRIMAFIISRLAARRERRGSGIFVITDHLHRCLPYMAELAYMGLSEAAQKLTRLVFYETDLNKIGFPQDILDEARKTGLLVAKVVQDLQAKHEGQYLQAEFLHLSIQELFAAAHMMKADVGRIESYLTELNQSGCFNMNQLFLFGMGLDSNNRYIVGIKNAILSEKSGHVLTDHKSNIESQLLAEFEKLCEQETEGSAKYQLVQTAYESQRPDMAVRAAKAVVKKQKMTLHSLQLTAVDIKALMFMMEHTIIKILSFENIFIDDGSLLEISKHISCTWNLRSLQLCSNSVSDEGMKHLSEAVKNTKSLKHLKLMDNQVTNKGMNYLSDALANTKSLNRCEICNNEIKDDGMKYLSDAVKTTKCLTHLELVNNKITTKGIATLAEALKLTVTLNHLEFRENQITNEGMDHLAKAIISTTSLKHLELVENQITETGMKILSDAIKNTTSLDHLEFRNNHITPNGMVHFSAALNITSCLKHLELVNNDISAEVMEILSEGVKAASSLTHLEIRNNQTTTEEMKTLSSALQHAKCLKSLHFSFNQMTADGLGYLAETIKESQSLNHLSLLNNKIASGGMKHLSEAIKTAPKLNSLELQNNTIKTEAMACLADAIRATKSLSKLELKNNQISPERMSILADGIKSSTSLKSLHLSYNHITEGGIFHLKCAIKAATSLEHLEILNNELTEESMTDLADAIKETTSLRSLLLQNNWVTTEGLKQLSNAIETSPTLKQLILANNQITTEGMQCLSDAVRKTRSLRHLEFRNIPIPTSGMKHLCCAIKTSKCLHHLGLVNIELAGEGMSHLFDAVKMSMSLNHLALVDDHITAESMEGLATALRYSQGLSHLQLVQTGTCDEIMKVFGRALGMSKKLRCVQLAHNHISDLGVECLLAGVRSAQGLTHLQLLNDQVTPAGCELLSESAAQTGVKYENRTLPFYICTMLEQCYNEFLKFTSQ